VDPARVVVVDDGSRVPVSAADLAPAQVLRHRINLGKGMALRTGCEHAVRRGADAVLLMDGDGQHDPAEIPRLVAALEDHDLVMAARRLSWDVPWIRLMGNRVLNAATWHLYGARFTDVWCGLRVFRASTFDRIVWDSPDYSADVEMALRAARAHLRIREVEIEAIYHDAYKGVTVVDGLRLLAQLLLWKVSLLR
jgi:glycosyltransferase involved in cell wall biosynthesis